MIDSMPIDFIDIHKETAGEDLKKWAKKVNTVNSGSKPPTLEEELEDEKECKALLNSGIKNLSSPQKQTIIMMDEISVKAFCNRKSFHQYEFDENHENSQSTPYQLELDLSCLTDIENVKIVICLSPLCPTTCYYKPFELKLADTNSHHKYLHLSARYRCTRGILDFLNLVRKGEVDSDYNELAPKKVGEKDADEIIEDDKLPPQFKFEDNEFLKGCNPVIWIFDKSEDLSVINYVLGQLDNSKEINEIQTKNKKSACHFSLLSSRC